MLQQLAPNYIDTGRVRLVYRNFPVIGQESEWAAEAALCAADQNKFWTYGNYLFTHQAGENTGAFSRSNLKAFAVTLGLNAGTFNSCFDGGKYTARVQQELNEGRQRGVQATPTFFINGKKYAGALSYNQFVQIINSAQ